MAKVVVSIYGQEGVYDEQIVHIERPRAGRVTVKHILDALRSRYRGQGLRFSAADVHTGKVAAHSSGRAGLARFDYVVGAQVTEE